MRTPLKARYLPNYTRGQEIANMVTHIVGGGLGVLILLSAVLYGVGSKSRSFTPFSMDSWCSVVFCRRLPFSFMHCNKKAANQVVRGF